jgi:hypothetical protein
VVVTSSIHIPNQISPPLLRPRDHPRQLRRGSSTGNSHFRRQTKRASILSKCLPPLFLLVNKLQPSLGFRHQTHRRSPVVRFPDIYAFTKPKHARSQPGVEYHRQLIEPKTRIVAETKPGSAIGPHRNIPSSSHRTWAMNPGTKTPRELSPSLGHFKVYADE